MATTKREKLFTEFPPVSTEQWEEVIKADLKGADYERKLVWKRRKVSMSVPTTGLKTSPD